MKVLHILNELKFSGAEILLSSGARFLHRDGVEHVILSTGNVSGEYSEILRNAGFEIIHLPFSKSIGFFIQLRRLIIKTQTDVLHIHAERASFFYGLLAKALNKHCIRTIHNEFLFRGPLRIARALDRKILSAMGVVFVSCSPKVQRNELKRFKIKTRLIDNWFDPKRVQLRTVENYESTREMLGIAPDKIALVSIGNYGPAKNHEAIISAIRKSRDKIQPIYFHCGVGGGELKERMSVADSEPIIFLGSVDNIGDYLKACDAFVSASFFEGGQISLLEAAASGILCITTQVGLAETFAGQPNIIFVQPDAESICDALISLPDRDASIGFRDGRALSSFTLGRYLPERGVREYMELYTQAPVEKAML
jgi:glycosyltransferase involved in cell wall biosynthesis